MSEVSKALELVLSNVLSGVNAAETLIKRLCVCVHSVLQ